MNVQHDPEINGWYRDSAGKTFQVIAVDDETVELQHFGGELEEVTLSVWYALPSNRSIRRKTGPAPLTTWLATIWVIPDTPFVRKNGVGHGKSWIATNISFLRV